MIPTATAAVLLAAPEVVRAAWLEGLGPLLLLLFWIVRQVTTAISEQKEAERVREARARGEGAEPDGFDLDEEPALAGRAAEGPKQGDLRSEVEEFLKRIGETREADPAAAEARAAEARNMSPPVEDQQRRGPIDPFEEPIRRRTVRRVPVEEAEEIELLLETPEAIEPPPNSRRVELRHLPESQLAENAALMGDQISQTDERLEARLHHKFDHRLGNLDSRTEASAPAAPAEQPTGAARIKAMLAKPGGVREAVILSEILRRPSDSL